MSVDYKLGWVINVTVALLLLLHAGPTTSANPGVPSASSHQSTTTTTTDDESQNRHYSSSPLHIARVELREQDDSILITTSGFLSDIAALGQLSFSNDQNNTNTFAGFPEGFFLTSSATESDLFRVQNPTAMNMSGCTGFYTDTTTTAVGDDDDDDSVYVYDILQDQDAYNGVASLGFSVEGGATAFVTLPFDYQPGEFLAGSAVIPFATFTDLNVLPGDLCYVEWLGCDGDRQRVELVMATPDWAMELLPVINEETRPV